MCSSELGKELHDLQIDYWGYESRESNFLEYSSVDCRLENNDAEYYDVDCCYISNIVSSVKLS